MALKILSEDEVNAHFTASLLDSDAKDLTHLLHSQFGAHLHANEYFQVTLKRGSSAAYLKIELMQTEDRGNIFEFFMKTRAGLKDTCNIPEPMLDVRGHALEQHFQSDREAHLPLDYTPYLIEGHDVYAREAFRDFALEKAADAWLEKDATPKKD